MDPAFTQVEPVLSMHMLDEVERLAYLQLSIPEIAVMAEIETFYALRWMEDRQHPFFIAVTRGRLKLRTLLNEALIPMAMMGEAAALISIEKNMERQKILDS